MLLRLVPAIISVTNFSVICGSFLELIYLMLVVIGSGFVKIPLNIFRLIAAGRNKSHLCSYHLSNTSL